MSQSDDVRTLIIIIYDKSMPAAISIASLFNINYDASYCCLLLNFPQARTARIHSYFNDIYCHFLENSEYAEYTYGCSTYEYLIFRYPYEIWQLLAIVTYRSQLWLYSISCIFAIINIYIHSASTICKLNIWYSCITTILIVIMANWWNAADNNNNKYSIVNSSDSMQITLVLRAYTQPSLMEIRTMKKAACKSQYDYTHCCIDVAIATSIASFTSHFVHMFLCM